MLASSRTARRTLKARSTQTRATARIARNHGGSLTTYAIAAGLDIRSARSMAGSLRTNAAKLHLTGRTVRVHAAGRMRDCAVYSPTEVALIAAKYSPRKPAFKTARAHLLLAA
ncbi:hypothetical protein [Streptacidiphilus sp. EB129]|jgi:hypothetical protein|uniref:hypothetical protein n=1 Tax=Streptacidiphilus sp. EB129 TaxID=3156262 RepID=UPI00351113B8